MPESTHKQINKTERTVFGRTPVNILSRFEKRCLFCGKINNSITYTCNCKHDKWFNEYRVLDLKPVYSADYAKTIHESFRRYTFDHANGIVQYKGLPFRAWYPRHLDAVGMTPLYHLRNLSDHYNTQFYIKDEGQNPSGCFKDRETLSALLNTRRRGLRHAVIYSSGNAAASAAIFAQKLDMQLITFVAGDTYPEKTNFICAHGSDVIVIGDENTTFEEGFRIFAGINAAGIFAANGFDNWSVRNPYRVQGDKTTAIEMARQFTDATNTVNVPDWVLIPTANGSCLAGIWKGFNELRQLGIISKLPRMVAAGVARASPVFQAVKKQQITKPERCDLSKVDAEDAKIGSTILAEEGYDTIEAARAVLASGGLAIEVNHLDIKRSLRQFLQMEYDLALEQAILPEPASLVSMAAIEKIREQVPLKNSDTVVALITGHGIKAKEMLRQLLPENQELQTLLSNIINKKKSDITSTALQKGRRMDVGANFNAVVNAFRKLKHHR